MLRIGRAKAKWSITKSKRTTKAPRRRRLNRDSPVVRRRPADPRPSKVLALSLIRLHHRIASGRRNRLNQWHTLRVELWNSDLFRLDVWLKPRFNVNLPCTQFQNYPRTSRKMNISNMWRNCLLARKSGWTRWRRNTKDAGVVANIHVLRILMRTTKTISAQQLVQQKAALPKNGKTLDCPVGHRCLRIGAPEKPAPRGLVFSLSDGTNYTLSVPCSDRGLECRSIRFMREP
jgi:hypothetical protein